MRILFDVNVLLDFLLDRDPFANDAELLIARIQSGDAVGILCASSLSTLLYVSRKSIGNAAARKLLAALIELFEVAPVNRAIIEAALSSKGTDFEDNVLVESGKQAGATVIVTRDARHFTHAGIPAMKPSQLLAVLDSR